MVTQPGPLTELTQASQLLEQVLVHIRKATLDHTMKAMEALQILEGIIAFLAQSSKERPAQNPIFPSAIAVCRR